MKVAKRFPPLTVILLVDDRNSGPVEKRHEVLESLVQVVLRGIEVYTKLLERRFEVDSGL